MFVQNKTSSLFILPVLGGLLAVEHIFHRRFLGQTDWLFPECRTAYGLSGALMSTSCGGAALRAQFPAVIN